MTVKQIGIATLDAIGTIAWVVHYVADQAREQLERTEVSR